MRKLLKNRLQPIDLEGEWGKEILMDDTFVVLSTSTSSHLTEILSLNSAWLSRSIAIEESQFASPRIVTRNSVQRKIAHTVRQTYQNLAREWE